MNQEPVIVQIPTGDKSPKATLDYGQDVRTTLKELPDQSVHMIATSPPYYGLRDYGTGTWEGGDPTCDHKQGRDGSGRADGIPDVRGQRNRDGVGAMTRQTCRCGAHRVDDQLGLEETPDAYIEHMVEVFREAHRVLRNDGTLWLNLGDSYANDSKWGGSTGGKHVGGLHGCTGVGRNKRNTGLKAKDLVGIPWRVALALQADGWYLRSDIIWSKTNPMPESVTDRPTKAHEYIFLLTKQERYFYDSDAVREPAVQTGRERADRVGGNKYKEGVKHSDGSIFTGADTRNRRSVWTIPSQCYPGAHFATWPEALVKVMIKAGTSEKGCCPTCGSPWKRVLKKTDLGFADRTSRSPHETDTAWNTNGVGKTTLAKNISFDTVGWEPTCKCPPHESIPCVVLDPFSGSGTTGRVSLLNGRDYVGIDLNLEYLNLACARIRGDVAPEVASDGDSAGETILDLLESE